MQKYCHYSIQSNQENCPIWSLCPHSSFLFGRTKTTSLSLAQTRALTERKIVKTDYFDGQLLKKKREGVNFHTIVKWHGTLKSGFCLLPEEMNMFLLFVPTFFLCHTTCTLQT